MNKDVQKFGISDKRGRSRTSDDPYRPQEGLKEMAVCESCKALYRNKRWYLDPAVANAALAHGRAHPVICPACQKMADHYPEGLVTLQGEYLWDREEEIRNILHNEETKAMAKNPLERIMRLDREGDVLVIETTEQKLAEHLGRALHKAHQGILHVSWADDHSVCRVNWHRP